MRLSILKNITILFLLLFQISCGGNIGTGVGNPPTNPISTTNKASAAVSAVFATSDTASLNPILKIPQQLMNAIVKKAMAQSQSCDSRFQACICEQIATNGRTENPENVSETGFRDPGVYGSTNNSLTLTADDFCTQPDGTTQNQGSGPGGEGLFAGFFINTNIEVNCTENGESTTIQMVGNNQQTASNGIFRNTTDTDGNLQYAPQVYGSFIFAIDGEETSVNCTLFLGLNEEVEFADCSDADGNTIEQSTSSSCVINSGS